MPDASDFRELERRCSVLAKVATEPEVKAQLRLWAVEFANEALEAERRAAGRKEGDT